MKLVQLVVTVEVDDDLVNVPNPEKYLDWWGEEAKTRLVGAINLVGFPARMTVSIDEPGVTEVRQSEAVA